MIAQNVRNIKSYPSDGWGCQIEGVVTQFDPLAAQVSGNSIAIAVEGNGGRLVDFAFVAVEESLAQFLRVGGAGTDYV